MKGGVWRETRVLFSSVDAEGELGLLSEMQLALPVGAPVPRAVLVVDEPLPRVLPEPLVVPAQNTRVGPRLPRILGC